MGKLAPLYIYMWLQWYTESGDYSISSFNMWKNTTGFSCTYGWQRKRNKVEISQFIFHVRQHFTDIKQNLT